MFCGVNYFIFWSTWSISEFEVSFVLHSQTLARARVGAQSGLGPGPGWGPYGPIWALMGPYGPIWAHMGPPGQVRT